MKYRVAKLLIADKKEDMLQKFRLQMFAEDRDGNDPGDDLDDDDDPDNDPDDDDGHKWTDEEVNALVERKMAEWQKKQEKKQKKASEAERLKNMTDEEKKAARMKELEDKVAEFTHRDAIASMEKQARSILAEKNISVGDAVVSMLVSEDADDTKDAVEAFATAFQDAVKKAVAEALKGKTPKVGGASKLTKEEIMKISDRTKRQQAIRDNISLFQ